MATSFRGRGRHASHRHRSTPNSLPSCRWAAFKKEHHKKEVHLRKRFKIASEKKDWEDATCSVCMEYPHNAVLLLCSSHEKGCRPYMCGTSYRYSNCLDQFKKAYTRVTSPPHGSHWDGLANNSGVGLASGMLSEKCEIMELACPLCRGQVKGMTVVEPARKYLDAKMRSCTQDDCSFAGTYKELRKHVKLEHPYARPREVDPVHEQRWRSLEQEREHEDVLSTIWATTPRARVLGDYVIEGDLNEEDEADDAYGGLEGVIRDPTLFNLFFMYHTFGQEGNASFQSRLRRQRGYSRTFNEIEDGVGFLPGRNVSGANVAGAFVDRHNANLSSSGRRRGRVVGRGRPERRRRRQSQRRAVLNAT